MLYAKADKMFLRTVQQTVLLTLNSVPVTFVTDPELLRPSVPAMTHFFGELWQERQWLESARLRLLEMSK